MIIWKTGFTATRGRFSPATGWRWGQKAEIKVKGSDKLAEMVASPIQSNNDEDEAALIAKLQALQVTEESLEKKKGLEDMNR